MAAFGGLSNGRYVESWKFVALMPAPPFCAVIPSPSAIAPNFCQASFIFGSVNLIDPSTMPS